MVISYTFIVNESSYVYKRTSAKPFVGVAELYVNTSHKLLSIYTMV